MKYIVMECGVGYAVVMDSAGRFIKVPNLGYELGQTVDRVVIFEERRARLLPGIKKAAALAAALAACLCIVFIGIWNTPRGSVRMQINPEVVYDVNVFGRVIELRGLNRDGEALIDGYRVGGKGYLAVADELALRARDMGFLMEHGRITVTAESKKAGWAAKVEAELEEGLASELAEWNIRVSTGENLASDTENTEPAAADDSAESAPYATEDESREISTTLPDTEEPTKATYEVSAETADTPAETHPEYSESASTPVWEPWTDSESAHPYSDDDDDESWEPDDDEEFESEEYDDDDRDDDDSEDQWDSEEPDDRDEEDDDEDDEESDGTEHPHNDG